ncbi:MAG: hypothetical protein AB8Y17_02105 [Coxiella endosymbiont of Dermacentor silvarum]
MNLCQDITVFDALEKKTTVLCYLNCQRRNILNDLVSKNAEAEIEAMA